ncbi:hypothetical protein G6F68_021780 [Rhizopus microsporus]|nr:hypothetical protein G6F68_021780 [Rhizopus microsporus]
MSGWSSKTPAAASRRNCASASSIRSSPPSRWAAAPGWACRSPTASSTSTTAASTWTAPRASARASAWCCP